MLQSYNAAQDTADQYRPYMQSLSQQNGMGEYMSLVDSYSFIFIFVFIIAMSIVLWNTGLLAGLRRYKEFGIRLALGEAKRELYTHLIYEAILIGLIGSILGTVVGLAGVIYMQVVGIDISGMMKDVGMLMPTVMRAKFTYSLLFIGFIPGLGAMVLGTALAGLGIYKRETAQLFKELEV
jgi:putative ABC transport system permease protein